jgi:hypothetical protein
MRRILLIAIPAVLLLILLWIWHARDGATQVHSTFERLKEEVTGGDAAGVVSELSPDYDYANLWPYFDNPEVKTTLGGGDADPKNRDLAKRGLAALFFAHREHPYTFLYDLKKIDIAPDGTATVTLTLEVGDGATMAVSGQQTHTFIMVPSGLFGTMRIKSHDKFIASVGM